MTLTRAQFWQAFGIAVVVFAVFGRALGYGFVRWDDPFYISNNPLVQPQTPWPADGFLTPALGYPIPVTVLLYRGVALLFGVTPVAFHALNLLLHATNAALLYLLLRRTASLPVAWLGTALWALHPLVVEPVTWCTGTKDLLYALGFLLTLHGALVLDRVPPWLMLLGLAAMLAKPTAVVLPVCLFWTVLALHGRAGLRRPGLAMATVVLGGLAIAVAGAGVFVANHGQSMYRTMDASVDTPADRIAAVLQALDMQVRHTLWPMQLLPTYYRVTGLDFSNPRFWRGLVFLALAIGAAVGVARSSDRRLRWWLGLAVVTYAPVSMALPILRFSCDSYAYVPLLCVAALIATALERHLERLSVRVVAGAWSSCLLVLALQQQPMWHDSVTLWGTNLAADSKSGLLVLRYARALAEADREDDAWQVLHFGLPQLQHDREVDDFVLLQFAKHGTPTETRTLFAWTYANLPKLSPEVHRVFCTYVAQERLQLNAAERQNMARALDALRRYHARRGEIGALLALSSLAAQTQLWPQSGALAEQVFGLNHDRQQAEAAIAAYQIAHMADDVARVQAALASPSGVR